MKRAFKFTGYTFVFLLLSSSGFSQQNNTLYFMSGVAQSSLLNPAYTTKCNYFGLPVLSSFYLNYSNTAFSYNELFPPATSPRTPDFNFLENNLHNLDLTSLQFHTNLVSLGIWYNDYYISFNIIEKADMFLQFPDDLFKLFWEGNTQYVGEEALISRVGLNFNHYREYSIGISSPITDNMKMGVRPKLLFGKLNLNTRKEELSIYTDEEKYDLDIKASYLINASLPITVEENDDGTSLSVSANNIDPVQLLLNRKNVGFAVDWGGIYNYTDEIDLYGSIIDLGFIRWADNPNNIEIDQEFQFRGLTESDVQSENYIEGMIDSVTGSWDLNTSQDNYYTFLPLKLYLGITYDFSENMQIGILNRNFLYKSRFFPSFTLSYNAFLFDFLSLSASYSYNQYSFKNVGLGFSVQNKSVQFYMTTDNLLAIKPLSVQNINLRFGLNIFFNCRNRRQDVSRNGRNLPGNCFWIERRMKKNSLKPK